MDWSSAAVADFATGDRLHGLRRDLHGDRHSRTSSRGDSTGVEAGAGLRGASCTGRRIRAVCTDRSGAACAPDPFAFAWATGDCVCRRGACGLRRRLLRPCPGSSRHVLAGLRMACGPDFRRMAPSNGVAGRLAVVAVYRTDRVDAGRAVYSPVLAF